MSIQHRGPTGSLRPQQQTELRRATAAIVDDAVPDRADPDALRTRLPSVLHDSPAAVLLLDVPNGQVVQANPAGHDLVDTSPLPLPAAAWRELASLTRSDGTSYPAGADPVSRLLAGAEVSGERVLTRGSPQWLTGCPLPGSDPALALLVLLPVEATASGAEVRDRAVVAAGLAFTISDPRQPDNPLIFVNPAFERTTGYSAEEVLHTNCRFLQGPDTDPAAVQKIRDVLAKREHRSVTLLNYRKDGTAFWNEVALSPVFDGDGELTHYVGIQSDVTVRVGVEQERKRHLLAEREARMAAEGAQRRLALLAEATSMLASTLDVDESLDRLTALVVPVLADFCTVHLLDDDGGVQRIAARHRDPAQVGLLHRLEELQSQGLSGQSVTERVLAGAPAQLVRVDEEVLAQGIQDPELLEVFRALEITWAMVVPLRARRNVLGVLTLFASTSGRDFKEADLSLAADLGRRAALTVDNARLYQREHRVAEQLQRSLLPVLPVVPGLDVASRYLPGVTAARVGGDWYDVLVLPDGAVGVAIGDVMGHDLAAAASMGQLRSVLQSYAWQGSSPPVVLDRLDQLVQGLSMAQLATCVYGRLDRPTSERAGMLRLANAGHLPPALREPDGTVRLIATSPDLLVGAALGTRRTEVAVPLQPGSVLVLCTDGLVEQRGRSLDTGLVALQDALASAPLDDAEAIADHLVATLGGPDLEDDVALLVLRILSPA